jgi:uncharacterized protein YndB with AHSA1/START domain
MPTDVPAVTLELRVPAAPAQAFRDFAERFGEWWPRAYTWSGSALASIGLESRLGGRCTEHGPHGFQCDWGRVVDWRPPERLALTWQVGPDRVPVPDPARASTITVTFVSRGEGTLVRFRHDDFARHGDGAEGYRDALAAEQGWPYILARYTALCGTGAGRQP